MNPHKKLELQCSQSTRVIYSIILWLWNDYSLLHRIQLKIHVNERKRFDMHVI